MNRAKLFLGLGFFMLVFCFSFGAEAKKYYRYKDSDGRVHIKDSPAKVPAMYRDQLEVMDLKGGKVHSIPERWYVYDSSNKKVLDVKFNGLILYSARQSNLIYWLLGEIVILIVFIVVMLKVRDFPTRAERFGYGFGFLIAFIAWLILSLGLGLRPASGDFCRTSRAYLSLVRVDARVPSTYRDLASQMSEQFLTIQNNLP